MMKRRDVGSVAKKNTSGSPAVPSLHYKNGQGLGSGVNPTSGSPEVPRLV